MNALKTIALACVAVLLVLLMANPALAFDKEQHGATLYGAGIGAGLGAGLTIFGAAMGFGRIGSAALESMARQPETAARVQTAMIIIGALLEGATFFSLVICFMVANQA